MGYRVMGRAHAGAVAPAPASRAGDGRVRRADPARRRRARRRRRRDARARTSAAGRSARRSSRSSRSALDARALTADAAERVRQLGGWRPAIRCASARSACSTPASAGSPSCTSCSSRCRTRTSSTSATPRASRTATATAERARALRARDRRASCSRGGAKLLVVACNSATAAALPRARSAHDGDDAGRRRARRRRARSRSSRSTATRNGRIGLLATPATVASGAYERAVARRRPARRRSYAVACPDLAPIIQGGFPFDERVVDTVRAYCEPLREADVDTVILGCTHYPLVAPDAPAHARPRRRARHLGRRPSRARSSTRSARRGLAQPARAARATTASCAPATSRRSARSARASCRCRSATVEHVDLERGACRHDDAPRALRRPRRRTSLRPVDDRARLRAHRDRLGADLAPARRA